MTTALDIDYEWLIGRINDNISLGDLELVDTLKKKYVIPFNHLERALFLEEIYSLIKSIDITTYNKIVKYYDELIG